MEAKVACSLNVGGVIVMYKKLIYGVLSIFLQGALCFLKATKSVCSI